MLSRLQGKGDGAPINTSGLNDNWDDPEGRYCKLTKFWPGFPLLSFETCLLFGKLFHAVVHLCGMTWMLILVFS